MARKLRREVQTPQRKNTGLSVMLVASAAMFFAVAGSAFILRARMAAQCCPHDHATPSTAISVEVAPGAPAEEPESASTNEDCGRAIYHNNQNGTVTVTFPLCADPVPTIQSSPEHIEVILVDE